MSKPKYLEFKWRKGFNFKGSAEDAYHELERVRTEKGGKLTRDDVKEAARPKASPIHKHVFDCSKAEASERYYGLRAGDLLRSIEVVYAEKPGVRTNAYVTVEERPSESHKSRRVSSFTSTREALGDPEHRQYVLANALQQLFALRKKYAALSELAPVFDALERVAEDHETANA